MSGRDSVSRRRLLQIASISGIASLAGCVDEVPLVHQALFEEQEIGEFEFQELAHDRGFHYTYKEPELDDMIDLTSDAGVYVSDYNNDGWEDILAIGGEEVILFRNDSGSFERSTALPSFESDVNAALFFDHNNNGWDDLLLFPPKSEPVFFRNQEGEFTEDDIGIDITFQNPVGASAADATNNGYLDVFVIQNGDWRGRPKGTDYEEVGDDDNGNPNALFHGDGETLELAEDAGIEGDRWTLATAFVDITGDGYPDIYSANDFNYDVLYLNRGDGTFDRQEMPERSDRNAMAAAVGDINQNGKLDIFVTNIFYDEHFLAVLPVTQKRKGGNNLFINEGDGEFSDRGAAMNVHKGGWGWAAVMMDFNNDGNLEIFHTVTPQSGTETRIARNKGQSVERTIEEYPFIHYPVMFQRLSENRFTSRHPPDIGIEKGSGRGVGAADFMRSGTVDLAIADSWEEYQLYENKTSGGNWLQVDVMGTAERTPIGTKLYVSSENHELYQVYHSNVDFLSQSSRIRHFGIGFDDEADLSVEWQDGTEHDFEDIEANQRIRVHFEGDWERIPVPGEEE